MATRQVSERTMILLVAAVQFVNILDFMIVMPLGKDFSLALDIPTSQIGWIGGSYTASAAIAGLLSSKFLDRFDRRAALAFAMLGLVLGTAAGALATGLASLMAARVIAGAFGGPATALSLSIVADVIPPERRGKAMGVVMGAFAVASVLGVPAGLELARQGGWQLPFLAVAALGVVVAACAVGMMPKMTKHLEGGVKPRLRIKVLLARPLVLLALLATSLTMMSSFVLIPNFAAYLQDNLGYPRERMGLLYLVGGSISLFTLVTVGRLVDRIGAPIVSAIGTTMLAVVLFGGFIQTGMAYPVMAVFVGFMASMSFRAVAFQTLSSRVPDPNERAGFMSLQSAVQHMSSAVAAVVASLLLQVGADGKLEGMPSVGLLSLFLALPVPVVLWLVDGRVRRRESALRQQAATTAA